MAVDAATVGRTTVKRCLPPFFEGEAAFPYYFIVVPEFSALLSSLCNFPTENAFVLISTARYFPREPFPHLFSGIYYCAAIMCNQI